MDRAAHAMHYDYLIVGSGAGGCATAYQLVQQGRRVLLLEKGGVLPRDGSTLDAERVIRRGEFLSDEPWLDRHGQTFVPEEHFNLGGKTRWYGAALLRFAPHEFDADAAHQCLAWPFGYDEIAPWYDQAERLLGVNSFPVEPGMRRLVSGLKRGDARWREQMLGLALSSDILRHPEEAAHYDAFASVRGLKADGEGMLERLRGRPNLDVLTGKAVAHLIADELRPTRVVGVQCEDGTRHYAKRVILAAGALHSPRLLQGFVDAHAPNLPCARNIGRNYKSHMLTAMLAFSHRRITDVLCKTLLLLHEAFAHSTVQTLGGTLAADIVRSQLPAWVPRLLVDPAATRACGLFLQTEDGSHPDNRVSGRDAGTRVLDYDPARLTPARAEHAALVRTLQSQLLRLGYVAVARPIPLGGTAHACGTLVTGRDPAASVVDGDGRVHGLDNLYVSDGSVLPRSSRVNPALTIYAWGLRLAHRLVEKEAQQREIHHDIDNAAGR